MAKRKKAQPWDAVFDRVRVRHDPEIAYWRKPSEAELNLVEAELGASLPKGYRAFAERFAVPGHVMGYLRLYPVRNRRQPNSSVVDVTRWFREEEATQRRAEEYGPLEQLRRLVLFGDDFGGGTFAWDTGEITYSEPLEYQIVWIPRNPSPLIHRSNTFSDFLQWVYSHTLELDEQINAPPDERRDPSYIRFEPLFHHRKRVPTASNIALWLASNNNTARDLALSIRDRGHTDAFPILADALQEAGCTNADLLDSCRTGDPDIDGVWVLRVLLGEP